MLLAIAFKSTVILVVAFAIAMALRRASAAMRHLIWICAFGCLLALPLLEWSAPKWQVAVPAPAAPIVSAVIETASPASANAPVHAARPLFNFALIWMCGVGLALARLSVAFLRLRSIAAKAEPWLQEADGTSVLLSGDIDIPITFGVLRPRIVFPRNAADWPRERFDMVLAHELAHVRRFDCLTQLLAELLCAIYWFNPLVWLAVSECRKERERACDDAVLNQGTKSSDYAEHLLGVVRSIQSQGASIPMALSFNSHNLQERLKAVLKPQVNRRAATPKLVLGIALAALCIIVPVATMRAQAGAGSLGGSIYDASRAAIPHAMITATNADTHQKEVAYTGPDGSYVFRSLPAGKYLIEVRAPGFKLFQQMQNVAGGANVPFYPVLDLGQITETLEVVGQKPASVAASPARTPQRIKVGGNVHPGKLVYKAPLIYPEHAKQSGIEGAVVLQAVIGKEGNLLSVEVLSKSVDPELAQAARDSVSQWRYEPALLNGEPVEVVTTVTVNFRLE